MTEQTEGAEVETLAKVLGDIRVAEARQADWWTDDAEHSLLIRVLRGECVPWAAGLLASDWLAAREAAAEARGAQAVLAAVTASGPRPIDQRSASYIEGWRDAYDAVRAAAAAAGGGGDV
jgi:hypothetical protein